MPTEFLLLSETARLLGVKPYQVTYALVQGFVPEPRLRIGNRRVFQAEDVQRLALHFGLPVPDEQECLAEH